MFTFPTAAGKLDGAEGAREGALEVQTSSQLPPKFSVSEGSQSVMI